MRNLSMMFALASLLFLVGSASATLTVSPSPPTVQAYAGALTTVSVDSQISNGVTPYYVSVQFVAPTSASITDAYAQNPTSGTWQLTNCNSSCYLYNSNYYGSGRGWIPTSYAGAYIYVKALSYKTLEIEEQTASGAFYDNLTVSSGEVFGTWQFKFIVLDSASNAIGTQYATVTVQENQPLTISPAPPMVNAYSNPTAWGIGSYVTGGVPPYGASADFIAPTSTGITDISTQGTATGVTQLTNCNGVNGCLLQNDYYNGGRGWPPAYSTNTVYLYVKPLSATALEVEEQTGKGPFFDNLTVSSGTIYGTWKFQLLTLDNATYTAATGYAQVDITSSSTTTTTTSTGTTTASTTTIGPALSANPNPPSVTPSTIGLGQSSQIQTTISGGEGWPYYITGYFEYAQSQNGNVYVSTTQGQQGTLETNCATSFCQLPYEYATPQNGMAATTVIPQTNNLQVELVVPWNSGTYYFWLSPEHGINAYVTGNWIFKFYARDASSGNTMWTTPITVDLQAAPVTTTSTTAGTTASTTAGPSTSTMTTATTTASGFTTTMLQGSTAFGISPNPPNINTSTVTLYNYSVVNTQFNGGVEPYIGYYYFTSPSGGMSYINMSTGITIPYTKSCSAMWNCGLPGTLVYPQENMSLLITPINCSAVEVSGNNYDEILVANNGGSINGQWQFAAYGVDNSTLNNTQSQSASLNVDVPPSDCATGSTSVVTTSITLSTTTGSSTIGGGTTTAGTTTVGSHSSSSQGSTINISGNPLGGILGNPIGGFFTNVSNAINTTVFDAEVIVGALLAIIIVIIIAILLSARKHGPPKQATAKRVRQKKAQPVAAGSTPPQATQPKQEKL